MKVKDLLKTKREWTKKAYARTDDGFEVDVESDGFETEDVDIESPDATRFCLCGAIARCYPKRTNNPDKSSAGEIRRIVFVKLGIRTNMCAGASICWWNDDPKRTFTDVRKLIEELDI